MTWRVDFRTRSPAAYRVTVSQRRLPAEIYWRRRLLVLAVLIALAWIVLKFVGGSGDDPKTASTTPAPIITTTAAPVVKVNGRVPVTLVSATKPCDPQKIRIVPTVPPDQLTKGPVKIGLVVSSTSDSACTLTADQADAIAVISANGTAVWDSTVCKDGLISAPIAVSSDWATLATVEWTGRGSGSKCNPNEGFATPGTYTLQIGTLGGEPGKTTFTLGTRPEPKPAKTTKTPTTKTPTTKTPEPTKSSATPKPPKTTTKPADG